MPMRDDASYCRPRLYDADDPQRDDDVNEVLNSLERSLEEAMDDGDKERVSHLSDLMRRVADAGGESYSSRADNPAAQRGT